MNEPVEQSLGLPEPDSGGAGKRRRTYQRVPLTPEAKRENMRGWIAASLMVLLALTLAGSFVLQWVHPERTKDWLNMVLSPLIGLVGAATGFYFGASSAKKD